jgi:hypothetical protein
VLVEFDRLAQRAILLRTREESELLCTAAVRSANRGDYRLGIDPLVHMEGDGRHVDAAVLRLAGPVEAGIEVLIVGVPLLAPV